MRFIHERIDATIVGASVKLFLRIFKMNFPGDRGFRVCGTLLTEGVFHNLVVVSIRKSYPL